MPDIIKSLYDDEEKPLRAIVFSDDITAIKTAEEHYEQYKQVITADAEYVWEANLTQDLMINEASEFDDIFNQRENQTYSEIHRTGAKFIVDEQMREYVLKNYSREALLQAFSEAKRELNYDYPTDLKDGKGVRWMHLTHHLMTNVKGDILMIMCVKDVSKLHNEILELEKKAEEDSLTGLYNRYALKKRISKIMLDLPDASHGFIIFDIDMFKSCNDTYGHQYGDDILCITAETMRQTFRSTDILCRLGGDEYVIFMISVNEEGIVKEKAQELIQNLKNISVEKNLKFPINISIGATLSRQGEDFETIYERMDHAMYVSKRNGRGQSTFI